MNHIIYTGEKKAPPTKEQGHKTFSTIILSFPKEFIKICDEDELKQPMLFPERSPLKIVEPNMYTIKSSVLQWLRNSWKKKQIHLFN